MRVSTAASPEIPHRSQTVAFHRILNPLTMHPDIAHGRPRNPSLRDPVEAHYTSRKASPDTAQSHAQQGFGVALTFLT